MNMNTEGWTLFARGDDLVEVIVINREDGDETRESIYHPSVEDLQAICFRHGLPVDEILELVRSKEAGVHTFMIDVQVFLKHLEEKEQTFLLEIIKGKPKGYIKGTYSYTFDCPMCDYMTDRDVSLEYVEHRSLEHLGDGHRVRRNKIRIEIKEA